MVYVWVNYSLYFPQFILLQLGSGKPHTLSWYPHCLWIILVRRKILSDTFLKTVMLWNEQKRCYPNKYNLNLFKLTIIYPTYPHIYLLLPFSVHIHFCGSKYIPVISCIAKFCLLLLAPNTKCQVMFCGYGSFSSVQYFYPQLISGYSYLMFHHCVLTEM